MYNYQTKISKVASTLLLAGVISACNSSSSNKPLTSTPSQNISQNSGQTIEAFPTTELFLDFNLPFSVLNHPTPDVSGISFNYEEDYFLISSVGGNLLFVSPVGEVLDEINMSSAFTGVEFIGDATFLLSDVNRILKYRADTQEIEEIHEFVGQYENIQSIAYNNENEEIVFVDNGEAPVLVVINSQGVLTELPLDEQFTHYAIDGLQLAENYLFMGSPGYQLEDIANRNSVVIKAELDGRFVQAWSLDDKVLSGLAILDIDKPEFITTNLEGDGSFNLYEPEALPSAPSEQPLNAQEAVELDFNQPSGIDYLTSNNTFYYMTDFGEVRLGSAEGDNELLFEIETQQGSYEAIAASLNNDNDIELHVITSDDSLKQTLIEKYNVNGELLAQFELPLIHEDHLFEALDFAPSTHRYYTINGNDDSRKYLYVFDNETTETFELSGDYDDYYISGIDYLENSGHLYFITEEFEDENGKNAGLMIIYDVENAIEIGRYSIIDVAEPEVGLENPSGITISDNGAEIYITSDVDDATLHKYNL